MVQTLHTEIEMKGTPAEVRSVFLDFSKHPEWHTGFTVESTKSVVEKGDKLNVNAAGTKFVAIVLENSIEQFRWVGSIPVLFCGEHTWRFEPSKKTSGGTTFIQTETFTGLLSFLLGPGWSLRKDTLQKSMLFNESLKRRVEA